MVKNTKAGLVRQSSNLDEGFVHINEWHEYYGGSPFSRTETIILNSYRSEEPVTSNMDISTGHIVLVSTNKTTPLYGKLTNLKISWN